MKKKNPIVILAVLLASSLLFTALTAVLPTLPFTYTEATDFLPMHVGFPFPFVQLQLTSEQIKALGAFNTSFILPRYDQYPATFDASQAVLSALANAALFLILYGIFLCVRRFRKQAVPALLIGTGLTVLSMFLPVAPGTFRTAEDLNPMRFGFPFRFVEQTPNIGSLLTDEDLESYLAQSYIAPNYTAYATRLQIFGMLASVLVWALAVFLVLFLINFLRKKGKRA